MSNPNLPWFRMYSSAVDNEKLRLLAFEDRWHFTALLCCKGQGIIKSDDPLLRRKVAVKLGLDLRAFEEAMRRLSEVDLIDLDTLEPKGWDEHQMLSDSSAARVRAHRARKKAAQTQNEGSESAGQDSNSASNSGNGYGNVTVTPQDKDKEEDTDKDKEEKTNKKANDADASGVSSVSHDNELDSTYVQVRSKTAITTYCRSEGINATPNSQKLDQLVERGVTMSHFIEAVSIAKQKQNTKWPYVMGIAENLLSEGFKPPTASGGSAPKNKKEALEESNRQAAEQWLRQKQGEA